MEKSSMIRLPFFDTLKCASRSQNILWTCQVANLLIVLRVGTVVVAVGPEPQLRVGVEAVAKDRHWVEGRHEITDVSHLHL